MMITVLDELGDGFTVVGKFVYEKGDDFGRGYKLQLVGVTIEAPVDRIEREIGSVEVRAVSTPRLRQLAREQIARNAGDSALAARQALAESVDPATYRALADGVDVDVDLDG